MPRIGCNTFCGFVLKVFHGLNIKQLKVLELIHIRISKIVINVIIFRLCQTNRLENLRS